MHNLQDKRTTPNRKQYACMRIPSITKSVVEHLSASFAFNFSVQKTQGDSQWEPNNCSDDACFVTSQSTINRTRAAHRPNRPNCFVQHNKRERLGFYFYFFKKRREKHMPSFLGHVPRLVDRPSQDDRVEEETRLLRPWQGFCNDTLLLLA
jgi:hypothetical protein